MTTQTQPPTTVDRVRSMMARHNLSQAKMATLLGTTQGAVGNWISGTREPNKVVARLMDVLEQAEMFYPTLFKTLLGQVK